MPHGGLLPRFPVRLGPGVIIASPKEASGNYPQPVFPGWPWVLGGSTAQQADPVSAYPKLLEGSGLPCPHPEIPKRW